MEISALEAQSVRTESAGAADRRAVDTVVVAPRRQFIPFHERDQRFACVVIGKNS
jgi:hypothetical protein